MNYMDKITEMLGVELGEEFKVVHNMCQHQELEGLYHFCERGLLKEKCAFLDCSVLAKLLNGDYLIKKLLWKPQNGDRYFIPNLKSGEAYCTELCWDGKPWDEKRYKAGMVCKTADEAVEKAEKMLDVLKEGM